MKTRLFLLVCLFIPSHMAVAEGGCPPGQYPPNPANTNVCYPFPDQQTQAPAQQQPQAPSGRWETRCGAIATDAVAGTLAGVVNFSSKRSAQKAAATQCKANGGENCLVRVAFYNQCAVVAWGDTYHTSQSAGTAETASDIALQKCAKETNNCKVYYSGCSPPVWISY